MASYIERLPPVVLRLVVIAASIWGIWSSWQLARADYLFRKDTDTSIRHAISWAPDAGSYYMRLAEFEPAHAQELLSTAVHLNPYLAQADIELGLQYEAQGEIGRAEESFLRAFSVDHTYLPRWSLASFYFRQGRMTAFWTWARRAVEVPSDSTGPLFELCWRVSPDAIEITQRILNHNPKLLRQYLDFLLSKHQASSAAEIAIRIIEHGRPDANIAQMFAAINQLVADKDGEPAKSIWRALIANHWVTADPGWPNNPKFAREPLPVRFDWSLTSSPDADSLPGPSGLETEFSGLEPEQFTIAEQAIVLVPGKYRLEYSYRTDKIDPGTGLKWQIADAGSVERVAESTDLSSATTTIATMDFSIPPGSSLAYLRLIYHRALGTEPVSGSLVISSVTIHSLP